MHKLPLGAHPAIPGLAVKTSLWIHHLSSCWPPMVSGLPAGIILQNAMAILTAVRHCTKPCSHLLVAFSPGFCLHRAGVPPEWLSLQVISYFILYFPGLLPRWVLGGFEQRPSQTTQTCLGWVTSSLWAEGPSPFFLPQLPQRGVWAPSLPPLTELPSLTFT